MSTSFSNVTVTTAATVIIPSNPARKGYGIVNNGSVTLYFGPTSAITTTTAMSVSAGGNVTDSGSDSTFKGAIYGIVATGSTDVRWWDWT